MKEYTIIKIVSDSDPVKFQEKREILFTSLPQEKEMSALEGVNAVLMPTERGPVIIMMPYIMIEYGCTKEEHDTWKFSTSITTT